MLYFGDRANQVKLGRRDTAQIEGRSLVITDLDTGMRTWHHLDCVVRPYV
jgi:hypothetical protein